MANEVEFASCLRKRSEPTKHFTAEANPFGSDVGSSEPPPLVGRSTTVSLPRRFAHLKVGASALVGSGCGIAAGNGRFIDLQCTFMMGPPRIWSFFKKEKFALK